MTTPFGRCLRASSLDTRQTPGVLNPSYNKKVHRAFALWTKVAEREGLT
jgi:hypothetical protein